MLLSSHIRNEKSTGSTNFFLLAVEEVMFWAGLVALLTGKGWVSVAGGVLLLGSLILIFMLLQ